MAGRSDVAVEPLQGGLSDRQEAFLAALANDFHARRAQVDVLQVQSFKLGDPDSVRVKQLHRGPIPDAGLGVGVDSPQQLPNLGMCQDANRQQAVFLDVLDFPRELGDDVSAVVQEVEEAS